MQSPAPALDRDSRGISKSLSCTGGGLRRALGPSTVLVALVSGCAVGANAPGDGGDAFTSSASSGLDSGGDTAKDHVPDTGPRDAAHDHATGAHDAGHDATSERDSGRDATAHDGGARDGTTDARVHTDAGDATVVDTGVDVFMPTVDASVCPNGMGTIAIVGGSAHIAFGATSINGEAWKVLGFGDNTVASAPALAPYGTGFLALFPSSGTTYIESTQWSAAPGAWSAPAPVLAAGGATATEVGTPAHAVLGACAELIYQGSNDDYYQGTYSGGTWGVADLTVGGMTTQDTGLSPASAAVAGGLVSIAFGGTDHGLYVDTWSPSGGYAAHPLTGLTGAGVSGVSPTLVALDGGSADLMIVYVEQTTNYLKSIVHTPASGWAAPVQVSTTATSTTSVSLAPLANGGVVMVYEGMNGLPYSSIYNPSGSTWTAPISVYPNSLPLQSPPSVAPGVCGVDAIVALTETEGVEVVTLTGGVFSAPVLINGTTQMVYATIATSSTALPLPDAAPPVDAPIADVGTGHDAAHDSSTKPDSSMVTAGFTCPGGQGTVALLGGSSIYAFGATSANGGAWAVSGLGQDTVGAPTALVPYGSGGYLGLFAASLTGYIESTLFTTGWSAPTAIGVTGGSTAAEVGGPALALLGANAELVYQGTNDKLYHGEYAAGAWGLASDPVGGTTSQDFSDTQPSTAAVGDTLFAAYDGTDNGLYVDTWQSSRGWGDESAIFGAGVGTIPPTIIALTPTSSGPSPDLMLVFEFQTSNIIYSTVHTPGVDAGAAWGPVQQVNATANTYSQVALAALPGGDVELVYEGENSFPYSVTYSGVGAAWGSPVAVYPEGDTLLSQPSVAPGICGYDAVAALVEQNGVQLTTFSSGTWATPVRVPGLSAMTFASIATTP